MIPRYTPDDIGGLWTDRSRFATWLEVELLAVEAWADIGVIPKDDAVECRRRAPEVTDALVAEIDERERITDHDVAAFVDVVQSHVGGSAGKWIHYGLTSSDVVDTALCVTLTRVTDVLIDASTAFVTALIRRAREFRNTPMVGRTHGIHAEPTTFGGKLALWALQADRDRERLRRARAAVAVGKLSGAVGTYSNIDPRVEDHVCRALGLTAVPATQVIARDRHAELLYACAATGASIEQFATEIRHLQRTEVREAEEPFRAGQKGSSAMPHKRNPIKTEQLSGLARVLRGNVQAGLENIALWHERDISHSSVERVILPDSSILTGHVLRRMTAVIDGLVVHPDRMLENLDRSYGLVFSQPVLLALVAAGATRDAAYRIVQRNAMQAWEEGKPFRTLLEADPEVSLTADQLDDAFSLERALANTDRVFAALDDIDTD